jgi:hypothetical protein
MKRELYTVVQCEGDRDWSPRRSAGTSPTSWSTITHTARSHTTPCPATGLTPTMVCSPCSVARTSPAASRCRRRAGGGVCRSWPGSLVLNVDDLLERWTGGVLRATPHRVVTPAGAAAMVRRQSVAYFRQPDPDALVEPAPALHGVPQGLRYRPVRAGVHISRKELGRHAVAALRVRPGCAGVRPAPRGCRSTRAAPASSRAGGARCGCTPRPPPRARRPTRWRRAAPCGRCGRAAGRVRVS